MGVDVSSLRLETLVEVNDPPLKSVPELETLELHSSAILHQMGITSFTDRDPSYLIAVPETRTNSSNFSVHCLANEDLAYRLQVAITESIANCSYTRRFPTGNRFFIEIGWHSDDGLNDESRAGLTFPKCQPQLYPELMSQANALKTLLSEQDITSGRDYAEISPNHDVAGIEISEIADRNVLSRIHSLGLEASGFPYSTVFESKQDGLLLRLSCRQREDEFTFLDRSGFIRPDVGPFSFPAVEETPSVCAIGGMTVRLSSQLYSLVQGGNHYKLSDQLNVAQRFLAESNWYFPSLRFTSDESLSSCCMEVDSDDRTYNFSVPKIFVKPESPPPKGNLLWPVINSVSSNIVSAVLYSQHW